MKKIKFNSDDDMHQRVHDVISTWLTEIDNTDDYNKLSIIKDKVLELEQVINKTGKPNIHFSNTTSSIKNWDLHQKIQNPKSFVDKLKDNTLYDDELINTSKLDITIFKIIDNINLPLATSPSKICNASIGDFLVCIGSNVYCKNWSDEDEDDFLLLLNDSDFIFNNNQLFENLY